MKFFSSASALLALTCVSSTTDAFSFSSLAKVASIGEKVSKVSSSVNRFRKVRQGIARIKRQGDPIVFEDVHLPYSMSFKSRIKNILQLQRKTNKDVGLFIGGDALMNTVPELVALFNLDTAPSGLLSDLEGDYKPGKKTVPRSSKFLKVYSKIINRAIKVDIDDADPCEGYLYFGNQEYSKILPMLCKVNPFWASALTVAGDNDEFLELNAFNDQPEGPEDSKYLTIMRHMPGRERRINVRFNKDMTINRIVTYESRKEVIVPEEEWDYYASGVCYNMFYYCSVVHALIHNLHYLMTTAISQSTRHDKSLSAWAAPYDDNIALKWLEVAAILFASSLDTLADDLEDKKVLTGKKGLGGTKNVMPPLRDMLCLWGSCKNEQDFMEKFLLKEIYATAKNPEAVIQEFDILTEFQKHMSNVQPFADDLTKAMKKDDKDAFEKAEAKLTTFMSECGENVSSIDSISSWVQLMCSTGLLHGSTLSYTRLIIMPEVMRWRNIKDRKWDKIDTNLMTSVIGTVQGMTTDRHVFTGHIQNGKPWNTDNISKRVKRVLDKYDDKAEGVKLKYKDEIKQRDDFREFGWILTDHCPDGYDGKQHTITTYI